MRKDQNRGKEAPDPEGSKAEKMFPVILFFTVLFASAVLIECFTVGLTPGFLLSLAGGILAMALLIRIQNRKKKEEQEKLKQQARRTDWERQTESAGRKTD